MELVGLWRLNIEEPRGVAGVDGPHNSDSSIGNMVGPDVNVG